MMPQIFPPVSSKIIQRDYAIQPRHVNRVLGREFERNPIVGIYGLENWLTPYVATALHADQAVLVFKPEKIPLKELAQMIDTQKIMVIYTENAKYQFTVKNIKIDKGGLIICSLPTDLYMVQRRDGFRVSPPPDESFKLIVGLGAAQELLTNVVNVSRNGLQLDMRAGVTEVSVGGYWHTCYFERQSSSSANFNLQIQHSCQGNDVARLRVGCKLYEPTTQTLKEFENIVDTISRARLMANLKKWYLDLDWWNG
jgi:hypothetical protein